MNSIKLLKTNKPNTIYGVICWFFVLSGGKFYLDWLLITNPTSRNPIIKLIYGFMHKAYSAKNYRKRYYNAYIFGIIHLFFVILHIIDGSMWSIVNILVNIYPIIVQGYVGYRCWRLKNRF